ncbi:MAG: hypothetical protein WA060_00440 [Minisyncoccia bacterium]
MPNRLQKQKGGYTIIETMITISLFTIIVMSGMGALLNANALHQKSQSMRSILDSLSFITEDISRNLRTGSRYHCLVGGEVISPASIDGLSVPKSCGGGGWAIAFEPPRGDPGDTQDQWIYYISNDGKIFKAAGAPYGASDFVQLTPDGVVVDVAKSGFVVYGAEPPTTADRQQPFIIIRFVGSITYKNVVTPFSIQTSASQRTIDI